MSTYILKTPEVLGNCLSAIAQAPVDGTVEVSIGRVKEKRRTAQNALYWVWMADLEKDQGDHRNVWHDFFRVRILSNIYLADPQNEVQRQWVRSYNVIADMVNDAPTEEAHNALEHVRLLTSTTWASVEQFTEYLAQIEQFCIHNSYKLSFPDDYKVALGLR